MQKIEKYVDYFHDGSLFDIEQRDDEIQLFISSAEVDREDVPDLPLTRNRLKGILILRHVKKIEDYEKNRIEILRMLTEFGELLDFEIVRLQNNQIEVELNIRWCVSKKKFLMVDYSGIKITCEEVSWEPYIPRKHKPKKN